MFVKAKHSSLLRRSADYGKKVLEHSVEPAHSHSNTFTRVILERVCELKIWSVRIERLKKLRERERVGPITIEQANF